MSTLFRKLRKRWREHGSNPSPSERAASPPARPQGNSNVGQQGHNTTRPNNEGVAAGMKQLSVGGPHELPTTNANSIHPTSLPDGKTRHSLSERPGNEDLRGAASASASASRPSSEVYPAQHRKPLTDIQRHKENTPRNPDGSIILPDAHPRTADTTVHERVAPAVTHETIHKDVQHVREEVITRDIHEYHVYHRVQPIVDVEVLPARHYVPTENGLREISASEVPNLKATHAAAANYFANVPLESKPLPPLPGEGDFSAQTFEKYIEGEWQLGANRYRDERVNTASNNVVY